MMLDDRMFEQEWVQNLSNDDFRLLMYLFFFATKSGIIELNMRMINFVSNTGKNYTKEDVLERFGKLITMVPGRDNTAIFPDWIATNWSKGKPIDVVRNPLFKSIVNELGSFGLTIEDVNRLAKKKIETKGNEYDANNGCVGDVGDSGVCICDSSIVRQRLKIEVSKADIETMFDAFWKAYPSSCPRKTEKKKCLVKFTSILSKSKDAVALFNKIMEGLEVWKKCDTWVRDGGQYIMSPHRWLNNENWNDTPKEATNVYSEKHGSANANYQSSEASGIF